MSSFWFSALTRLARACLFANLCVTALAADSTGSGTLNPTATPTVHVVTVANNGDNSFHPNVTYAKPGDIVSFQFWPTNHSVVRGEYTGSESCGANGCNPCVPYNLIHPGAPDMFSSGHFLVQTLPSASNLEKQSFNLTINSTNAIWYYCTALSSCAGNGMVGVINPSNSSMMDRQVTTAIRATLQLSPGESWPAEGMQPGSVNETTSTTRTSSTTTQIAAQNSTASSVPSVHTHKLSGGVIAGISLGVASVVLLCAALCYFVGRSQTYHSMIKHQQESEAASLQQSKSPTTAWSPLSLSPNVPGSYGAPFSGGPLSSSPQLAPATFVGYNRQTGAPEFVTETIDEKAVWSRLGHPAFGRNSRQSTTYELPGESPVVAEAGPFQ